MIRRPPKTLMMTEPNWKVSATTAARTIASTTALKSLRTALSLPIYPSLTDQEVARTTHALCEELASGDKP